MADVQFTDNSNLVLAAISRTKAAALEAVGIKAEGYAKKLCTVDTGRLRNSIGHAVQGDDVYIGTNVEYAAYIELGTGKYYPGGRDTPWRYKDAKGNWYTTRGIKAQPYLKPAAADHGSEYRKIIEMVFKNA